MTIGDYQRALRSICPALLCSSQPGKRRGEGTYDRYLLEENNNHDNQKRTKKTKGSFNTRSAFSPFLCLASSFTAITPTMTTILTLPPMSMKSKTTTLTKKKRPQREQREEQKKTINRNYPLSPKPATPLTPNPTPCLLDISH